jgi:hypothetical protein
MGVNLNNYDPIVLELIELFGEKFPLLSNIKGLGFRSISP